MKRIIDKETQLFLRDDTTWDEETEIALDVEPAQGLYIPKWEDGWIEGASQEYIDSLKPSAVIDPIEQLQADVAYLLIITEG